MQTAGVGGAPQRSYFDGWLDRGCRWQGWGMTETSPGVPCSKPQMPCASWAAGKCLFHTEVKVVDDEGLEPWGGGELLIRGPNITPK